MRRTLGAGIVLVLALTAACTATEPRSTPPPGSAVLAFRENANVGWEATQDGRSLTAVRVDGWQQGWLLGPDSAGPVVETYAPEKLYRWGLLLGLVGWLLNLAAIEVLPGVHLLLGPLVVLISAVLLGPVAGGLAGGVRGVHGRWNWRVACQPRGRLPKSVLQISPY